MIIVNWSVFHPKIDDPVINMLKDAGFKYIYKLKPEIIK